MSKEEMIDILKGLVFGTFDRTTAKEREALDMAIKVLEQEPYEDAISINPTNGDMIKALFPNNPYMQLIHDMALYADKSRQEIIAEFPMAWWNAPYKRGEE